MEIAEERLEKAGAELDGEDPQCQTKEFACSLNTGDTTEGVSTRMLVN